MLYIYKKSNCKTSSLEVKEAIAKAKQNDQMAFNFLLDTFWNDVYGFQLKRTENENDAEDISIQTFSKAFDKIATYDESYVFKTWLITISKNIHIDLLRKRKSSITSTTNREDDNEFYNIIDESPSPEDKLITEQNLAKLLRDIKKLQPHYQEIINLRYFQELSYKEISEQLQEPINNVKVKLLRAKKLLAEIITKK
ncbi:RNA polymerase subunit sigma-70 [Mangrovimonas sp. DI 80]|nr:RNA polymerase subunit sigma-70 [Mangrovimonas sp. DI 80]